MTLNVTRVAGGAVALALIAAAGLPARADAVDDIKALQQSFIAAVRAKDLDKIMSFYVPDDTLLLFDVVPPRQYVGAAAVRKDWRDFLDTVDGPLSAEMMDFAVQADNSLAWGHSIQRVSGKTKDGKEFDLTTRVTDIYKKADGRWAVVHEHVSVPVDLASGTADTESKP